MSDFQLTPQQIAGYHRDGYLIVKDFLSPEEIHKLYSIATEDEVLRHHAYGVNDKSGKNTRLTLWYNPGDDAFGLLTRSKRMIGTAGRLMDGDSSVCHFHSKLMQKEPRVGGAWEWHQDYGYWYKNEFLFPEQMISIMIAITTATKENGCLQVIGGSHKMGRIEHGFAGEQVGASQHYVDLALNILPLIYVELEPGDALFFHPNLLHRSAANLSDKARWSLISVYNRQANIGYNEPNGSATTAVSIVPDDALLSWESTAIQEAAAGFLEKDKDKALK
ncbi:MAG TPA: phytanoyl-CoA dioxygenase family protein [Puia sp.]|jgi:ectoine hydroxylase-related dioxygenase (phytanoyl-CoA dioxygenase family)|nr:phytanoyl-CoA dioxygenase family protein [Puia sp.]